MIWGGLSPELLAKISSYPELCREAERVLDSMYSASLPRPVHVQDLVNKALPHYYNSSSAVGTRKRKRTGRAMLVMPDPENDRASFEHFTRACVCQTGIHTHCFTCMKPPNGYIGCRLCKPSGDIEKTKPVELIDVTKPENVSRKKIKVEFTVNTNITLPGEGDSVQGDSHSPSVDDISLPDSRLIVWEIKRPLLDPLPQPPPPQEREVPSHNRNVWLIEELKKAMTEVEELSAMEDESERMANERIGEIIRDLEGMKTEDLEDLYNSVSKDLKDRNGMVADYNPILTALMGCNTNALFLGSKEQSKGALFYIGPYICEYEYLFHA